MIRHGGIFVGNLLPLSLACDHRVVDGATAALALAEIVKLLQEQPDSLMGPVRSDAANTGDAPARPIGRAIV